MIGWIDGSWLLAVAFGAGVLVGALLQRQTDRRTYLRELLRGAVGAAPEDRRPEA